MGRDIVRPIQSLNEKAVIIDTIKGLATSKNQMIVKLAHSGGFAVNPIETTPADLKNIKKWK